VPRTHNDEVNAAQSSVLNNNQLTSKKIYILKPPRYNKKIIGCKKEKQLLTTKLNGILSAFPIEHITSKCTLLQWHQLTILSSTKPL
jgi:hypothetical protein